MKAGIDYIGVGMGALILNDKDEILLAKRGRKAKNERGKWEIPGGALEFGETFNDGLKREIKEELNIQIEVGEMLQLCDHIIPDDNQHWVAPTFFCKIISGVPKILEPEKCDDIGWFTIEEAGKLSLSIVTQEDIKILKERKSN